MSINKQIMDTQTGVPISHHVVVCLNLDYNSKWSFVNLASFFDEAAFAAGKRALSNTQMRVSGVPADGQCAMAFIQAALIEAAPVLPATAAPVTNPQDVPRYVLAGGSIIDALPAVAAVDPTAAEPVPMAAAG